MAQKLDHDVDVLAGLFENNKAWAQRRTESDPHFFERLCAIQRPDYLWIGCADSRVPANEIVGLDPGELFVHRNVGNVVPPDDVNALSVIQCAIEVLDVEHIMVVGHYGCAGVLAAMNEKLMPNPPLSDWIDPIRRVRTQHAAELAALPDYEARWRRLCELNVAAQVEVVTNTAMVRAAWSRGKKLVVHGWVYDLQDGLIRDLNLSVDGE